MPDPPPLLVADTVRRQLLGLPPRPWEVGGWLLGYWTAAGNSLVVTHATPPAGRGTASGVWISGAGHRDRFDEAWDASGGHVTFLGDWHTHPGGPALPSARDAQAARQLAEEDDYGTPEPLMAITAVPRWRHGRTVRHTRWYVRGGDGVLQELAPRVFYELPPAASSVARWSWPRAAAI